MTQRILTDGFVLLEMPMNKSKDVESLRPTSANANANDASGDSSSQATGDEDELPLIWQKVSNKILHHINGRFDKLEQTLRAVQSSQKELLDKVENTEGQVHSSSRLMISKASHAVTTLRLSAYLNKKKVVNQRSSLRP